MINPLQCRQFTDQASKLNETALHHLVDSTEYTIELTMYAFGNIKYGSIWLWCVKRTLKESVVSHLYVGPLEIPCSYR